MEQTLFAIQDIGQTLFNIITHRIFLACLTAWFAASVLKMIIHYLQFRRMDFRLLLDTGRMPSSHSAFVSCLAITIGLDAGWSNPVFMLALGFAILIMNDAAGVRRAAGHQASILNRIVDDMYQKKPFRPERLKEFLGHTRLEVMAGMVIGLIVGFAFYA